MTVPRWHEVIRDAIWELAEPWGYRNLDPCEIYFRGLDGRRVYYKPDACWVYGRSQVGLVIWEVETSYNSKHVFGGIALARLTSHLMAETYPYSDRSGEAFRQRIEFRSIYDRRQRKYIEPGTRVRLRGSETSLVLVTPDEDRALYFERYLEVVRRDRPKKFWKVEVLPCPATSVRAAKASLLRSRRLIWLWR